MAQRRNSVLLARRIAPPKFLQKLTQHREAAPVLRPVGRFLGPNHVLQCRYRYVHPADSHRSRHAKSSSACKPGTLLVADHGPLGTDGKVETKKCGVRFKSLLGSPAKPFDDQTTIVGIVVLLSFQYLEQIVVWRRRIGRRHKTPDSKYISDMASLAAETNRIDPALGRCPVWPASSYKRDYLPC